MSNAEVEVVIVVVVKVITKVEEGMMYEGSPTSKVTQKECSILPLQEIRTYTG